MNEESLAGNTNLATIQQLFSSYKAGMSVYPVLFDVIVKEAGIHICNHPHKTTEAERSFPKSFNIFRDMFWFKGARFITKDSISEIRYDTNTKLMSLVYASHRLDFRMERASYPKNRLEAKRQEDESYFKLLEELRSCGYPVVEAEVTLFGEGTSGRRMINIVLASLVFLIVFYLLDMLIDFRSIIR